MEGIYILIGLVLGVMLYRLGRREGERGQVLPLRARPKRKDRQTEELLRQIESYDGKTGGRK